MTSANSWGVGSAARLVVPRHFPDRRSSRWQRFRPCVAFGPVLLALGTTDQAHPERPIGGQFPGGWGRFGAVSEIALGPDPAHSLVGWVLLTNLFSEAGRAHPPETPVIALPCSKRHRATCCWLGSGSGLRGCGSSWRGTGWGSACRPRARGREGCRGRSLGDGRGDRGRNRLVRRRGGCRPEPHKGPIHQRWVGRDHEQVGGSELRRRLAIARCCRPPKMRTGQAHGVVVSQDLDRGRAGLRESAGLDGGHGLLGQRAGIEPLTGFKRVVVVRDQHHRRAPVAVQLVERGHRRRQGDEGADHSRDLGFARRQFDLLAQPDRGAIDRHERSQQ